MRIRVLAALALLSLSSCTSIAPNDHRLTGRIWEPASGTFVERDRVLAQAVAADAVLLGETHDNPEHHALQAWVVRELVAAGRKPVVAFEMIDAGQAKALETHLATHPADAAGLGAALAWDKSGWPDWELYRPIAESALAGGGIRPANLSRDDTRALGRGQAPQLAARLGIDRPLEPALQAAMASEIKDSHCGMLPDKAVPAMVTVQRARDAVMARTLADILAEGRPAVLIAGTGHARADRGVPRLLAELAPSAKVLTIGFMEVRDGEADPAAYDLPFDIAMFTARAEREDQCEEFRKHMEAKGK